MMSIISSDSEHDKIKLGDAFRLPLVRCNYTGKYQWTLKEAQSQKNFHKNKDGISMRIYLCEHGNHYHLTSSIDREKNYDDTTYHQKINHRGRDYRRKNHYKHKRY